MATSRKHWFRVADSIAYEGLTPEEIGVFVLLLAHLNTRWAREGRNASEAGETLLTPVQLYAITGKKRLDSARKVVGKLSESCSIVVEKLGENTRLIVPKYAEFQGLQTPKTPPPQDARRKTQDAPSKRPKTASPSGGNRDSPEPEIDPNDNGERIARKLRLGAKSTTAERAEFVAAIFQTEVIPAARSEWSGRGSFWDVVTRILSARWNAYLNRERDPTRRAYYREASAREKRAALDRFEAEQSALDPPDPPDDPLLSKLAEIQAKRGAA